MNHINIMKTNVIYTHTQNKITVNMNHKYNEDKCDTHTHKTR